MANISELLIKIKTAIYGEDVRGAIHDSIEAMNEQAESAMEYAAGAVESAQSYAEEAERSKDDAKDNADEATEKLAEVLQAANDAQSLINDAQSLVDDAHAWVEGPDGTSEEPSAQNNAHYWYQKAKEIVDAATNGVSSFNGRAGAVEPGNNDYTAAMVGAVKEENGYISNNNVKLKLGVDGNGNYGYIKEGADTVTPFKNPQGTKNITANGTHDVEDYKSVSVAVPGQVPTGNVDLGIFSSNGNFVGLNVSGKATASLSVSVPSPIGSKSITSNGTHDVENYKYAIVDVPFSAYCQNIRGIGSTNDYQTDHSFSYLSGNYVMFFLTGNLSGDLEKLPPEATVNFDGGSILFSDHFYCGGALANIIYFALVHITSSNNNLTLVKNGKIKFVARYAYFQ